MEDILRHLVFLAKNFSNFSEQNIIKIFLLELGFSTEKNSFNYLVDSILIYGGSELKSTTKVIFPDVAKKYNTDKAAVGKAVERAIRSTWKNRDEAWKMYFISEECLTSTEFISRMAIIFDLWKACCRSVLQKGGSK